MIILFNIAWRWNLKMKCYIQDINTCFISHMQRFPPSAVHWKVQTTQRLSEDGSFVKFIFWDNVLWSAAQSPFVLCLSLDVAHCWFCLWIKRHSADWVWSPSVTLWFWQPRLRLPEDRKKIARKYNEAAVYQTAAQMWAEGVPWAKAKLLAEGAHEKIQPLTKGRGRGKGRGSGHGKGRGKANSRWRVGLN